MLYFKSVFINYYFVFLLLLSGLSFYIGFFHACLYFLKEKKIENLLFFFSSLAISIYIFCSVNLYISGDFYQSLKWQHGQILMVNLFAIVFSSFLFKFFDNLSKKIIYLASIVFSLFFLLNLFFKQELVFYIYQASIKKIELPFNLVITYYETALRPFVMVNFVLLLLFFLFIFFELIFFKFSKKTERKYFLFIFILLFIGSINDFFISIGFLNSMYVLEIVYFLIVILTSYLLLTDIYRSLEESEYKYYSLFNNAEVGIFRLDNFSQKIIDQNIKMRAILGVNFMEKISSFWLKEIFQEESHFNELYRKCMKNQIIKNFQIDFKNFKNQNKICLMNFVPDVEKGFIEGTCIDITDLKKSEEEKKQLQNQLVIAQKMESIGTLAAGVAHNFNNLLMTIQGYISLMKMDKEYCSDENLESIESYIEKSTKLTSQLLSIHEKEECKIEVTDINKLLNKTLEIFKSTKKNIIFSGDFDKYLWKCNVDPLQIEQVIMNIILNAIQAMPYGGFLKVVTKNYLFKSASLKKQLNLKKVEWILISIQDTGIGMSEEVKQKIFDPFFTINKEDGTGLGLALSYKVIQNHNGFIKVNSEVDKGTTFEIYLPALKTKEKIEYQEAPFVDFLKGNETILIIDDEEEIINVTEKMLTNVGYKIFKTSDPIEGIKIYKKNKNKIDLVILDLIMPKMSGYEVCKKIKKISPKVKILFSSGCKLEDQEILRDIIQNKYIFLQKPYNVNALSQAIVKILKH